MKTIGIGVDIVENKRIKSAIKNTYKQRINSYLPQGVKSVYIKQLLKIKGNDIGKTNMH